MELGRRTSASCIILWDRGSAGHTRLTLSSPLFFAAHPVRLQVATISRVPKSMHCKFGVSSTPLGVIQTIQPHLDLSSGAACPLAFLSTPTARRSAAPSESPTVIPAHLGAVEPLACDMRVNRHARKVARGRVDSGRVEYRRPPFGRRHFEIGRASCRERVS